MPESAPVSLAQTAADAFISGDKIKKSTTCDPEMRAALKEAFESVDVDGSGSISASELHELFLNFEIDIDEEEAQEMINNLDTDGEGEIEFEEFLEIMLGAMEDEDEVIKSTFEIFDLDGDQFIETKELRYVLHQLGETDITEEECRAMIENADFDNDGRVSFTDFQTLWKLNK